MQRYGSHKGQLNIPVFFLAWLLKILKELLRACVYTKRALFFCFALFVCLLLHGWLQMAGKKLMCVMTANVQIEKTDKCEFFTH